MLELLFAATLASTLPQGALPAQDPDPDIPAVELDQVVVTGQRLDDLVSEFVGQVAEPNRGRGLARWRSRVCVGVANLTPEVGQYIADRVSTVAEDIGLQSAGPGCAPNILIIATDDGGAMAAELVEERRRAFRMGGSGMDRGSSALEDFIETPRPIRWWQMALPVDSESGNRAVRIPGDCQNSCTSAMDAAPIINVSSASRLTTQIVDNITRAIVILDVNEVEGLSAQQLADYIAMVSLAQIDPDADTSAYASILNVFDDPQGSETLTQWDTAYLNGLYMAERNQANHNAARTEIVETIIDENQRLRAEAADAEGEDQN